MHQAGAAEVREGKADTVEDAQTNTRIFGDFNTSLSVTDKASK